VGAWAGHHVWRGYRIPDTWRFVRLPCNASINRTDQPSDCCTWLHVVPRTWQAISILEPFSCSSEFEWMINSAASLPACMPACPDPLHVLYSKIVSTPAHSGDCWLSSRVSREFNYIYFYSDSACALPHSSSEYLFHSRESRLVELYALDVLLPSTSSRWLEYNSETSESTLWFQLHSTLVVSVCWIQCQPGKFESYMTHHARAPIEN